jgi:hypothetical protein
MPTTTRPAGSIGKLLGCVLLAATLLPSCAPYSEFELKALRPYSASASGLGWTQSGITGLHLALVDPGRIEEMTFQPGGRVLMAIGQRNGHVSHPVYLWKLIGNELHVSDADGHFYDLFTPVSRGPHTLKLHRRGGAISVYRVR